MLIVTEEEITSSSLERKVETGVYVMQIQLNRRCHFVNLCFYENTSVSSHIS